MTLLDETEERGKPMDADALLFFTIDAPYFTGVIDAPYSGHLPPVTVTTSLARIGTEEEFFYDVVSVTVQDPVVYDTERELIGIYSHLVQFAIRQTLSDLSQAFLAPTHRMTADMRRDEERLAGSFQDKRDGVRFHE
ncbi:MAG: hypothetical protein K0S45_2792 [Nitrospira sp.]|jgi:hypothetical protein|nr:hypothetical protein [Nitrospira sp.]